MNELDDRIAALTADVDRAHARLSADRKRLVAVREDIGSKLQELVTLQRERNVRNEDARLARREE